MAQYGVVASASKNIWEFDPTTISGCTLWLDATDSNTLFSDAAGTIQANVGNSVVRWNDKSPLKLAAMANNNSAAINSNAVYSPTPPVLGTDSTSGKNAINFGVGGISITSVTTATNVFNCTTTLTLVTGQPIMCNPVFGGITAVSNVYYVFNPVGSPTTSFQLATVAGSTTPISVGATSAVTASMVVGSSTLCLPMIQYGTGCSQNSSIINITNPRVLLSVGQVVTFSASTMTGISTNTTYYVSSVTNNANNYTSSFTVSLYLGGPALVNTAAGTSTGTANFGLDIFQIGKADSTTFVVSKNGLPGVGSRFVGGFSYGSNSSNSARSIGYSDGSISYSFQGSGSTFNGSYIDSQGITIASIALSNQLILGWMNGRQVGTLDLSAGSWNTTNSTTGASAMAATVGARNIEAFMCGQVAEIIHFNSSLSLTDRQTVEGYLSWKWGMQSTLPADHPYSVQNIISNPLTIAPATLWLDASDASTVILSGSNVTRWDDKSGNGRNVAAVNTPTYSSNAINTTNGWFLSPSFVLSANSTISIFVVANVNSITTAVRSIFDAYPNIRLNRNTGGGAYVVYVNSSGITSASSYTGVNTIEIYEIIYAASSILTYVTGGFGTTGNRSSGTALSTSQPFLIGGGPGTTLPGTIHEVICFDAALQTGYRQIVEGYLAWKWGRQSALPSSHPYSPTSTYFSRKITRPLSRQFVPTDLDNCQVWLDPSDSSTIGYGKLMSQWNDKSGNNRVAYSLGGPRSISNYIDVSAGGFVTSPFQLATAGACSIFVCLNQYATSTINSYYFGDANLNTPTGFVIYRTNGNRVGYLLNGGNTVSLYSTTGINDIYSLQTTGSVATAFINGTSSLSTTIASVASLSSANSTYRICFSSTISGVTAYVCEILAYNKSVSTTERQDIEGYLAWKWGNQASLPVGHPYLSAAPVGFVPNTSVSGCQLWLDANDSSTIITAPIVTRLTEKTTNTVSTITGLPRYISGTYPAIRFTGADYFNFGTSLLNIGLEPFTIFAAVKSSSQTGPGVIPIIGRNFTAPIWWIGYNSTNIQAPYAVGAATVNAFSAPLTLTVLPHILAIDYIRTDLAGATTGTLYQNGQNLVSISATLATSAGAFPLYLGFGQSSQFMQGDIYEVIVYVGSGTTSPLTTLQRQQVEGYLAWKWGTQANLPAGHPYLSGPPAGFVPNTSVSGCGFWIDASDTTSILTTQNAVSQIQDKSGQGNNFTNALSTLTYGATLNGAPTLIATNSGAQNTLTSPTITRDPINHSYFAVYRFPVLTTTQTIPLLNQFDDQFVFSSVTIRIYENINNANSGNTLAPLFQLNAGGETNTALVSNRTFIFTSVRRDWVWSFTCNGSTLGTNVGTIAPLYKQSPTIAYTLSPGNFGAQLAELIIYNSALNPNQRQMVEGYLAWKWGIRTQAVNVAPSYLLPITHPYYKYPPPSLTSFTPVLDYYKNTFDPSDLSPAVWIDPQETSLITTDSTSRVLSIANKGTIPNATLTLASVSSSLFTISDTTFCTVGAPVTPLTNIAGTPGLTAGTVYYISFISGSTIRLATTASNAFSGTHISTITDNASLNTSVSVRLVFAQPSVGTGTGILGPLLTETRNIPSNVAQNGLPFLDFSNGGYYKISAMSIGGDFTTITITVSPPHNGAIPVGRLVNLNISSGVFPGSNSAGIALGPFNIRSATLVNSTTLLVSTAGTHTFATGNFTNVFLTINEGTYSGGADASGLSGTTYNVPSAIAVTATSCTTSAITLSSTTGLFVGAPIYFSTAFGGLQANLSYYIFSVVGSTIQLSNASQGNGFAARTLTTSATGSTGAMGISLFPATAVILTIPTNANTLGLMAIPDGHVRNNIGTIGAFITQAGTSGSTVIVNSYGTRPSQGSATRVVGYLEYGYIPVTSMAITGTNVLTMRTPVPHGLSSGDVFAINNATQLSPPFQVPISTSGTSLSPVSIEFTNATVSGTTLTITVASNPFYIGSPPTTYVGITTMRVILPYGTKYSNGTDTAELFVSSGTTLTGSNATTIVLTISASGVVDGALSFTGLPGMIDSRNTASNVSFLNGTQTASVGTTGTTIICPFSVGSASPVVQANGKIMFMSASSPFSFPSWNRDFTFACALFPVNGRSLECPNLGSALNTTNATVMWVSHLSTAANFRRLSRMTIASGTARPTVLGTATTLNSDAGAATTDYAISTSGWSGGAFARTNIRHGGNILSLNAGVAADTVTGPFRVNVANFNFTNSTLGTEIAANSVDATINGWRFSNSYREFETIAGGFTPRTLTPLQLRIGGDTSATTSSLLNERFYEGGIGDILIFNSVLTLDQRQLVEGYLAQKYGCSTILGSTTGNTINTSTQYGIAGGSVSGTGPWTHTLTGTFTTAFLAGSQVTVAGVNTPSTLNGVWTLTTASTTTITFLSSTVSTAWSSGGNVTSVTAASNAFIHPYRLNNLAITQYNSNQYTAGLVGWFDAANSDSFTFSSGTLVNAWVSGGGTPGISLVQTNAGQYPTLTQNALNGLSGLRFSNGTSLAYSSLTTNQLLTQSSNPEFTIFVVTRQLSTDISSTLLNFANNALNQIIFAPNTLQVGNQSTSVTSVPLQNVAYISTITRRGLINIVRTNGTSNGSTTFTLPLNFSGATFSITVGSVTNSDIYEIIVVRYAMSDQMICQIEGYLAWKWGLQRSLPSIHPYYKVRF